MRIYLIFARFKVLSGAERLILSLARELRRRGFEPVLVCHTMHPSARQIAEASGIRVVAAGRSLDRFGNRYLNAVLDYLSSFELLDRVESDEAPCVFFGASLPALFWFKRVRRARNRCLHFCFEPPRFLDRDREDILRRVSSVARMVLRPAFAVYRHLARAFVSAADAVLTQGVFGRSEIERAYGRSAIVIQHGPELAFLQRPERAPLTVMTVNYLHPRKRVGLFLQTLAVLRERGLPIRGCIVGEGPERQALEGEASRLGLASLVSFRGFVPDADLPAAYAEADLYLHTGRLESFGLSLLDALASGLAVVSVAEGGPTEILEHRVTGWLAEANPESLADGIEKLALDGDLRRTIGRSAAQMVSSRYGWSIGTEALVEAAWGKDVSAVCPTHPRP